MARCHGDSVEHGSSQANCDPGRDDVDLGKAELASGTL
jgi:hypothetical protein